MNSVLRNILLNPQRVIQSGLVAEYRFNEGSGQVLRDCSRHGYYGQLGSAVGADDNDPAWTTQGLSFDGTNDYVNVGDTGRNWVSVQIWFYNDDVINAALSPQAIMRLEGEAYFVFGAVTGSLANEIITVACSNGARIGWCHASDSVASGVHELDVIWNGSSFDILLDNESKTTTIAGSPALATASAVLHGIGSKGGAYPFDGTIYYALLYDKALTETERLYNRNYVRKVLARRGVVF